MIVPLLAIAIQCLCPDLRSVMYRRGDAEPEIWSMKMNDCKVWSRVWAVIGLMLISGCSQQHLSEAVPEEVESPEPAATAPGPLSLLLGLAADQYRESCQQRVATDVELPADTGEPPITFTSEKLTPETTDRERVVVFQVQRQIDQVHTRMVRGKVESKRAKVPYSYVRRVTVPPSLGNIEEFIRSQLGEGESHQPFGLRQFGESFLFAEDL